MNSPVPTLCPQCGKQRFRFDFVSVANSSYATATTTTVLSHPGTTTLNVSSVPAAPSITYNTTTNMAGYCTCTLEDQDARINNAYAERDKCLALLTKMAQKLGLETGIRIDDLDPSWPIVYIDLPSGQVSWHIQESELSWFTHLSSYSRDWDGHNTEEKYRRVLETAIARPQTIASNAVETLAKNGGGMSHWSMGVGPVHSSKRMECLLLILPHTSPWSDFFAAFCQTVENMFAEHSLPPPPTES